MADDCLFCKIVAGEIPSKKVYEDEVCYAFDDIEPEAPVHTLVVPKKHYENLNDNPDPELLGHLLSVVPEIVGMAEAKRTSVREPPASPRDRVPRPAAASAGSGG